MKLFLFAIALLCLTQTEVWAKKRVNKNLSSAKRFNGIVELSLPPPLFCDLTVATNAFTKQFTPAGTRPEDFQILMAVVTDLSVGLLNTVGGYYHCTIGKLYAWINKYNIGKDVKIATDSFDTDFEAVVIGNAAIVDIGVQPAIVGQTGIDLLLGIIQAPLISHEVATKALLEKTRDEYLSTLQALTKSNSARLPQIIKKIVHELSENYYLLVKDLSYQLHAKLNIIMHVFKRAVSLIATKISTLVNSVDDHGQEIKDLIKYNKKVLMELVEKAKEAIKHEDKSVKKALKQLNESVDENIFAVLGNDIITASTKVCAI